MRIKRDIFAKWLCPCLIKRSIVSGSTSKRPCFLEITVKIECTFYKSVLISQVLEFCYHPQSSQAEELSGVSTGCTASSHPVNCFRHRPVSLSTGIASKGAPIANDSYSLFVSEARGFSIYQCFGFFWILSQICSSFTDTFQQLGYVLFWLQDNIFRHTEPPTWVLPEQKKPNLLSPNYPVYIFLVLMIYWHLFMLIARVIQGFFFFLITYALCAQHYLGHKEEHRLLWGYYYFLIL